MNADTVTLSVYLGCYGVIVYSGCVTCCRSWQRSRQHTCSSLKKKKDSLATSRVVVVAVIGVEEVVEVVQIVEVVAVVAVVKIVEVVEIEGIKVDSTLAPPSQRTRRWTYEYQLPPAAVEQTLQRQDFLDQFRANTATSWQ